MDLYRDSKLLWSEKNNLTKLFLNKKKGDETELLQQNIYLYKGNYWVGRCFQMYKKIYYSPEKLKFEKRTVTLKDSTALQATNAEIENFIKQNTSIAIKPELL